MHRDYTQATFDRLKKTINTVNQEQWCGVTDAIGDFFNNCGASIGVIDSESYSDNIAAYHKLVVDMNDLSEDRLSQIFSNVSNTDFNNHLIINPNIEDLQLTGDFLESIASMFGNAVDGSLSTGLSAVQGMCYRLGDIQEGIQTRLENNLAEIEAELMRDAGWGVVTSLLSGAVHVADFVVDVSTGNYVGAAVNAYDTINDVFEFCGNAGCFLSIGIGYLAYIITDDPMTRMYCIDEATELQGIDGVASAAEYSGAPDAVVSALEFTDLAADTIDFVDSSSKFIENGFDMSTDFSVFGITFADYPMDTLTGQYKNGKVFISNVKTIVEWGERFTNPDKDGYDFFTETNNIAGLGKKWNSMLDDAEEFLMGVIQ